MSTNTLGLVYAADSGAVSQYTELPFTSFVTIGGKLYGIEAAAEYYFGTRASALTLSEAALLCGIPQKPNRYRSGRYPKAAARRHRRVLARLVAEKVLTASEAAAAEASFPGYRNFKEGVKHVGSDPSSW